MSILARRSWQVASKKCIPGVSGTSRLNRVAKRFFEAAQEEDTITEIQPFLGTGQYWSDTAVQLKQRMGEEAEYLTDEDVSMLQQSIRVAEYMSEKQKNVTVYPYKSREEAGNDDEIASIYGNVGH